MSTTSAPTTAPLPSRSPEATASPHHRPGKSVWWRLRRLMDSWLGAILGGAFYGAWATWANWGDGAHQALLVGGTHWATSAALTYGGTWAMRQIHGHFLGSVQGWPGALRTTLMGLGLTYATLLAVHALVHTQHILLTLAPGVIPNILFCTSYAALLMRTQKGTP